MFANNFSYWWFLNPPKPPFGKGGLQKKSNKFPPVERGA